MINRIKLLMELERDEGKRNRPYPDSVGKLTIGIGRNLDDVGLSDEEINFLFQHDVDRALDTAISWLGPNFWLTLDHVRQRALTNMAFNLGGHLYGFKNFKAALIEHDWHKAAAEMLNSKWAKQVGGRATRLASMMLEGESYDS